MASSTLVAGSAVGGAGIKTRISGNFLSPGLWMRHERQLSLMHRTIQTASR